MRARLELAFELLPVGDVFESLLPLHALAAERRTIALGHELRDRSLVVFADRRALERILSNLVENAIKYSRPGDRVTLQAERDAALTDAEERVRISVVDTGPGIESRHLPRLFERFYRADKGRTRDLGGTGLGLAIAKHLAEALGGTLDVKSEIGRGSSFSVALGTSPHATPVAPKSTQVGEAA